MAGKVLFVDDDESWRLVVRTWLKDAGYDVVTVNDAGEALLRIDHIKPSLILLDLDPGGENGLMLMKFMKRTHPRLPIIIYTGMQHDDQFVQRMLEQGAQEYLRKGTMEDLLAAVRKTLPQP
jgi:DNA-binding NtrC family response regulator